MKIAGRLGARSRDTGRTTEEPARQDRTRGRGRTSVEPGRTGPEGMGGPVWSQAVQDPEGRGGEEQRGPREQKASGAVGQCTPEGARNAGQCRSAVTSPDADPVLRGWDKGVQSSSVTSLKRGFGLYTG